MLHSIKPEKIILKTQDGLDLSANFYESSKKCILLLHQFSKNKESWNELIPLLTTHHSVLALDLRGHGESKISKELTQQDFKNMAFDVISAIKFLEVKGYSKNDISIIGASIGANLAQNFAASNPHDKLILLSPGLNYKGIELLIKDTQSLVIVSREDSYSLKTVQEIEKKCPMSECLYLDDKGHGTHMLSDELLSSIQLFLLE